MDRRYLGRNAIQTGRSTPQTERRRPRSERQTDRIDSTPDHRTARFRDRHRTGSLEFGPIRAITIPRHRADGRRRIERLPAETLNRSAEPRPATIRSRPSKPSSAGRPARGENHARGVLRRDRGFALTFDTTPIRPKSKRLRARMFVSCRCKRLANVRGVGPNERSISLHRPNSTSAGRRSGSVTSAITRS